jgi:hypothetical protein
MTSKPIRWPHGGALRNARHGDRLACKSYGPVWHGHAWRRASRAHPGGSSKPKGDTGPSSQAFHAINSKMHEGMDITFTGNADIDFVRGMIPHHQGAVDMAKTVIAFGKDPQIRKLAEEIVKAQETEIALMQTAKQNAEITILNKTARRMPGGSCVSRITPSA